MARWTLFGKKDKPKKEDTADAKDGGEEGSASKKTKSLRVRKNKREDEGKDVKRRLSMERSAPALTTPTNRSTSAPALASDISVDADDDDDGEKNVANEQAGGGGSNAEDTVDASQADVDGEDVHGEPISGIVHGQENSTSNEGDDSAEDSRMSWPVAGVEVTPSDDESSASVETSLPSRRQRADSLSKSIIARPSSAELIRRNVLQASHFEAPEKQAQLLAQQKNAILSRMERRLSLRPTEEDLVMRNIIPVENARDTHFQIKSILKKKLARRMSIKELHDSNIVKSESIHWQDSLADARERRNSIYEQLERSVATRPSKEELQQRNILVSFAFADEVMDAIGVDEYNRRAPKPWTRLTTHDKISIKRELNAFKAEEMPVHDDSKQFTRFHF